MAKQTLLQFIYSGLSGSGWALPLLKVKTTPLSEAFLRGLSITSFRRQTASLA